MKEHLEDLKVGGRPMSKKELRIKELETQNEILEAELELNRKIVDDIIETTKSSKFTDRLFTGVQVFLIVFLCFAVYTLFKQIKVDNMIIDNFDECVRVNGEEYCRVVEK